MRSTDNLTQLLSRIIRKNERELADFNVHYCSDIKATRPKVLIAERKLLIPRTWNKIETILEGLAPLIKKARIQMELDASLVDTQITSQGIELHRAVEYLESAAPQHLEAILKEAGFIRA